MIGKIHLPEICANICFGGAKRDRLFMAASTSLYSLYVGTTGAQRPYVSSKKSSVISKKKVISHQFSVISKNPCREWLLLKTG